MKLKKIVVLFLALSLVSPNLFALNTNQKISITIAVAGSLSMLAGGLLMGLEKSDANGKMKEWVKDTGAALCAVGGIFMLAGFVGLYCKPTDPHDNHVG